MDSKTETVRDNELIARFMGQHITLPGLRRNVMTESYYADELKYDSDWSWPMPVVEKIESLEIVKFFDITGTTAHITTYRKSLTEGETQFINITELKKIDATYQTTVEFIRWHNSQSPDTIK